MLKPILLSALLCSCLGGHHPKPLYPSDTEQERQWKQQYENADIDWEEYQARLATEKKPASGK